jgi:hypothetical protein
MIRHSTTADGGSAMLFWMVRLNIARPWRRAVNGAASAAPLALRHHL